MNVDFRIFLSLCMSRHATTSNAQSHTPEDPPKRLAYEELHYRVQTLQHSGARCLSLLRAYAPRTGAITARLARGTYEHRVSSYTDLRNGILDHHHRTREYR